MRATIALLFLLISAIACSETPELRLGKAAITDALRDPASAHFEDTFISYDSAKNPTYCGLVNAKNAYGGFTGKQRFFVSMYYLKDELKVLHVRFEGNDREGFETGWQANCAGGARARA